MNWFSSVLVVSTMRFARMLSGALSASATAIGLRANPLVGGIGCRGLMPRASPSTVSASARSASASDRRGAADQTHVRGCGFQEDNEGARVSGNKVPHWLAGFGLNMRLNRRFRKQSGGLPIRGSEVRVLRARWSSGSSPRERWAARWGRGSGSGAHGSSSHSRAEALGAAASRPTPASTTSARSLLFSARPRPCSRSCRPRPRSKSPLRSRGRPVTEAPCRRPQRDLPGDGPAGSREARGGRPRDGRRLDLGPAAAPDRDDPGVPLRPARG